MNTDSSAFFSDVASCPTAFATKNLPRSAESLEIVVERRIQAAIHDHPLMAPNALERKSTLIAQENASIATKRRKIFELADEFNRVLQPHTAFQNGCSHCCSLPTLIYRFEAERLAKASGRRLTPMSFRPREVVVNAARRFYGQPCPFLVNNHCSVYNDRPLICRLHHSLNDDATECKYGSTAGATTGQSDFRS